MSSRIGIKNENTILENLVADTSCYRYIDNADGKASGLRLNGFDVSYGRAGIRIDGDANDIVIKNGKLRAREINDWSDLPVGIDLRGTVHDVVIEDVLAENNKMVVRENRYTNGDGFSQESDVYNVTYRRCTAQSNSDGGFDLKGHAILEDCIAIDNGRNYRLWNSVEMATVTSKDAMGCHLWFNGKAEQVITIDHLIVNSDTTAAIFRRENNSYNLTIIVKEMTINVPENTLLYVGSNRNLTLSLPDYVQKDDKGFVKNCAPPPKLIVSKTQLKDSKGRVEGDFTLGSTAKTLGVPVGTVVTYVGPVEGGFAYKIK